MRSSPICARCRHSNRHLATSIVAAATQPTIATRSLVQDTHLALLDRKGLRQCGQEHGPGPSNLGDIADLIASSEPGHPIATSHLRAGGGAVHRIRSGYCSR
jgi:hypothetical protein